MFDAGFMAVVRFGYVPSGCCWMPVAIDPHLPHVLYEFDVI